MPFSDPILAGATLVRTAMQSENFAVADDGTVTGWQLGRDGSATLTTVAVGNTSWGIDEAGNATLSTLSVTAPDVTIGGQALFADILNAAPLGLVAFGSVQSSASTSVETGLLEVAFNAVDGRSYQVTVDTFLVSVVAASTIQVRLRDGGAAQPTTASTILGYESASTPASSGYVGLRFVKTLRCPDDVGAGQHRLLVCLYSALGTAITVYNNGTNKIQLSVRDDGVNIPNTGVVNSGGGGGGGAVTTTTKTYACTWSGSYYGDGSRRSVSSYCYQGYYSGVPGNGNQKSMLGFPYATIASDLSGASISKVEFYLYFSHWYYGSGGTAVIGTHNVAGASAPATWSGSSNRVQSASWPKPGGRWVTLPTAVGSELAAGTTKGIVIGPGPSTDALYYGYCNGYSQSSAPQLRITYTK